MNNKQLLQQYVDTGIRLPEYQIKNLPSDLLKSYLRKRLIAVESSDDYLSDYEFKLFTPDQRFQYAMKMVENGNFISDEKFESLTSEQRFQYTMKREEKGYGISNEKFELLTPEQRFQYAMYRVEKGRFISDEKFELLTPDQQKIFKDKGGKIYYLNNE
jgi:hypothetical protein